MTAFIRNVACRVTPPPPKLSYDELYQYVNEAKDLFGTDTDTDLFLRLLLPFIPKKRRKPWISRIWRTLASVVWRRIWERSRINRLCYWRGIRWRRFFPAKSLSLAKGNTVLLHIFLVWIVYTYFQVPVIIAITFIINAALLWTLRSDTEGNQLLWKYIYSQF